jgi:GntR family transcriptional regulator, transcriptional repressor for pyruvate dehydrogenase complex
VAIAAASGNRVLFRVMRALQDLHAEQLETSLRYENRVTETLADHKLIVERIVAGDREGAEKAMAEHLERSERAAMARLEGA